MRLKLSFCLLIVFVFLTSLIKPPSEKVNWETPNLFSTKKLTFKSTYISMECKDCKCLEIRTASGLTGLFIVGDGTFTIPSKSMSDKFSNCMIRFNPAELNTCTVMQQPIRIDDKLFYNSSMQILNNVFRHCYHNDMDALIPEKGAYALNFLSEKYGDLLASYSPQENVVYSFSNKKKY